MKRGRLLRDAKGARDPDPDQDEMEAALWRGEGDPEEVITPAVSSRGGLVAQVNTNGPPWFDEYTGEELPLDQVERGMKKELASFEHFGVTRCVPKKEVEGELVSKRWLLKRRDATTVKARIVVQQLNCGAEMDYVIRRAAPRFRNSWLYSPRIGFETESEQT